MTTPPGVSSSRDRLYAVLCLPLVILGVFLNPPTGTDPAYRYGEMLGTVVGLGLVTAVVFGIARWVRKGRPTSYFRTAFWTLLVVVGLQLGRAVGTHLPSAGSQPVISTAERQGLDVGPDSIRHAELGFALPNPGSGFTGSPVMQAKMDSSLKAHPDIAAWVMADPEHGNTLIIQAVRFTSLTEAEFRGFARGVRKTMADLPGGQITVDPLSWAPSGGDYDLRVTLPNAASMQSRCLSRNQPQDLLVVCVETITTSAHGMSAARQGLVVRR